MTQAEIQAQELARRIRSMGSERNRAGMARFGINTARAAGVGMAPLRPLARAHRGDHALALALWDAGLHEARILACMIDDPRQADREQLERWALDLDSWDLTDQLCNKLVARSPLAWELASVWAAREEEFVRRAGFSLIAQLAVHHKKVPDEEFLRFFALIEAHACDARNFVKKAVNWALRQLGKRSSFLRGHAEATADRLLAQGSAPARWIARDALRELAFARSGSRREKKVSAVS
ncbi:hypothetical protein NNJEOMEG_02724 [Fundidesulfovibrio magnetotacticus]|uniref:DNA alkylation repair enzyme n=1 Tax=Fundidesulfovibrio magnetotacticus TaxID=2730080 RepID=A0A6V8LYK4_9BACT|nr:DNA alkylation repair protein [Fundidesulfovibrio magnetotacticus]GFK94876.1 hypothetical protein NNJEOMEG_02724 [Fundidesulfovibrio magnetotacticus]